MKAITLRNLPEDLAATIQAEADRTGASLNATVIRLLQQALCQKLPRKKRDLSELAGGWSRQEADTFDRYLEESRRLDMELTRSAWKREDASK